MLFRFPKRSHSKQPLSFSLWLWTFFFLTCLWTSSVYANDEISDPLEGYNRAMFWFNDKVDVYLLEPVARAYGYVAPNAVKKGIGNFFSNLRYPQYLVSDLVQFKFDQAGEHTLRFVLNSTVGILGFVDFAKQVGLPADDEDFGLALAYHGVPAGPYFVLPLLGPSTIRDAFGKGVDICLYPLTYIGSISSLSNSDASAISLGARALEVIDTREGLLEAIETAKDSSVDYYLFTQSAYYQIRRSMLHDGATPDEVEEFDDMESEADFDSVEETTAVTSGVTSPHIQLE